MLSGAKRRLTVCSVFCLHPRDSGNKCSILFAGCISVLHDVRLFRNLTCHFRQSSQSSLFPHKTLFCVCIENPSFILNFDQFIKQNYINIFHVFPFLVLHYGFRQHSTELILSCKAPLMLDHSVCNKECTIRN